MSGKNASRTSASADQARVLRILAESDTIEENRVRLDQDQVGVRRSSRGAPGSEPGRGARQAGPAAAEDVPAGTRPPSAGALPTDQGPAVHRRLGARAFRRDQLSAAAPGSVLDRDRPGSGARRSRPPRAG